MPRSSTAGTWPSTLNPDAHKNVEGRRATYKRRGDELASRPIPQPNFPHGDGTISDVLVLILRPDQQDFQGTTVTVDVARKLDVPKMLLVVNKVLSSFDFSAVRRQVEETYQVPVAGVLPLSEDVVRNASSAIFSLQFPDHPWSAEVRAIAKRVSSS